MVNLVNLKNELEPFDKDYTGEAKVRYKNGDEFVGTFDNGQKKYGKYFYVNQSFYEGSYEKEKKEGLGRLTKNNKEFYYGRNFKNGKKKGLGFQKYPNGDFYYGEWKNNKKDGRGIYFFAATKEYVKSKMRTLHITAVNGAREILPTESGLSQEMMKRESSYFGGTFKSGFYALLVSTIAVSPKHTNTYTHTVSFLSVPIDSAAPQMRKDLGFRSLPIECTSKISEAINKYSLNTLNYNTSTNAEAGRDIESLSDITLLLNDTSDEGCELPTRSSIIMRSHASTKGVSKRGARIVTPLERRKHSYTAKKSVNKDIFAILKRTEEMNKSHDLSELMRKIEHEEIKQLIYMNTKLFLHEVKKVYQVLGKFAENRVHNDEHNLEERHCCCCKTIFENSNGSMVVKKERKNKTNLMVKKCIILEKYYKKLCKKYRDENNLLRNLILKKRKTSKGKEYTNRRSLTDDIHKKSLNIKEKQKQLLENVCIYKAKKGKDTTFSMYSAGKKRDDKSIEDIIKDSKLIHINLKKYNQRGSLLYGKKIHSRGNGEIERRDNTERKCPFSCEKDSYNCGIEKSKMSNTNVNESQPYGGLLNEATFDNLGDDEQDGAVDARLKGGKNPFQGKKYGEVSKLSVKEEGEEEVALKRDDSDGTTQRVLGEKAYVTREGERSYENACASVCIHGNEDVHVEPYKTELVIIDRTEEVGKKKGEQPGAMNRGEYQTGKTSKKGNGSLGEEKEKEETITQKKKGKTYANGLKENAVLLNGKKKIEQYKKTQFTEMTKIQEGRGRRGRSEGEGRINGRGRSKRREKSEGGGKHENTKKKKKQLQVKNIQSEIITKDT
ncbi:conserved Plasmodium protein, unknown function [Plasmodium ovale curtisi]|uniref:MORN repeat protein n=1 Tax=Plasmodium ovale curtisi TaxID=864141 RepID=A0A1A8VMC8_PLAOA|nr:conserved Plasmodium protein, unknown function [Plasmodium ovale curtisi]